MAKRSSTPSRSSRRGSRGRLIPLGRVSVSASSLATASYRSLCSLCARLAAFRVKNKIKFERRRPTRRPRQTPALRCAAAAGMLGRILAWRGLRLVRAGWALGGAFARVVGVHFRFNFRMKRRQASGSPSWPRRKPRRAPVRRDLSGWKTSRFIRRPSPAYFGLLNFTGHLVGSCVVACGFAIIRTLCSHAVRFGKLLAGRLWKSESRRKEKSHDSATHRTRRA